LLNLVKIAVKLNTFARFGFVDAKFATQAKSRQILVVDAVEMYGIALGLAVPACSVLIERRTTAYGQTDRNQDGPKSSFDRYFFHCVTSKPFSVIVIVWP
jgi:hypothetical protein